MRQTSKTVSKQLTAILLALSTALLPTVAHAKEIEPPPITIPQLTPFPPGLSVLSPGQLKSCLPLDVDFAVNLRLIECSRLPLQFAAITTERDKLWTAITTEAVANASHTVYADAQAKFDALQSMSQEAGYWPAWQVALIVASTAVGALMVGFLAGYVAADLEAK